MSREITLTTYPTTDEDIDAIRAYHQLPDEPALTDEMIIKVALHSYAERIRNKPPIADVLKRCPPKTN